jgi:tRNA(fMet)-specific endonuclease VapC
MRKSLIDTDIFSEMMRGRDTLAIDRAHAYESAFAAFTISAVTFMELAKGLYKRGRKDVLDDLAAEVADVEVIPFDKDTADLAGRISADLELNGQPIGRADPMIAATAIQHGLILVSGNCDHFGRIVALGHPLVLEDWRQAPAG